MLSAVAGLATLVFIGVAAAVGARLLLLAHRTRGLPEFSLGYGLLVIVGFGYPLALAGRGSIASAPDLARWLLALSAIPMSLGWAGVWVFTWRAFRPEHPVARRVTFAALAGLATFCGVSMHASLTVADPRTIDFGAFTYTGVSVLAMMANAWGCAESLAYHDKMRRRVALGLGDPVVANRFVLYAVVMATSFASVCVPTTASWLGINAVESDPVLFTSAITGLACSAALWLAFLPPRAYLARLRTA